MIGGHGMQQPFAILAMRQNMTSAREIDPCGTLAKRVVGSHTLTDAE
jgi:hypothetical protein